MRKLLAMAFLALMAALGWSAPAAAQGWDRVKCESWQYQPARCQVPGIVDARISQVIAGDCRPSNWGQNRDGIYVTNGCRAWFDVRANNYNNGSGWGGGGGTTTVRCESWQYKPARCGIITNGSVRLQRVIAGDCRQGQTWGWDRSAIWVNGGCRADFAVSGNGGGGGGGGWGGSGGSGSGQVVECSSWDYQPARCPVDNANSVQIEKVNGGECVLNRSWGWDRRNIWVKDGCRARFRVY